MLRLACLQFDVRAGDVAANWLAVERGLRQAREREIELVVLPEMWATSFPGETPAADELERWCAESEAFGPRVRELSGELGLGVCGSSLARAPEPGARPRNRLSLYDRGQELLRYDKLHLFSPTAEDATFSAGSEPPPVVDTRFGRIGALVCYDLRFGALARELYAARAELVLVPAQWPAPRAAQWRALVLGRAVELQAFVAGCNRTGSAALGRRGEELVFPGNSLIAMPGGETLAEGSGQPGLIEAEIELVEARRMRSRVPVEKDQRPELYRSWERPE